MTNKEAIKWLKSIDTKYVHGADAWYNGQRHEAIMTAIKALEFQHKMQYGNCDYCKHKNYASFEYPCTVCGDNAPYREMWEEAENEI